MSNIVPFVFEKHSVRVLADDRGDPLFVAKDVAMALGYAKPANAISQWCKHPKYLKELAFSEGQQKQELMTGIHSETVLIPESDLYRLTLKSQLESAERFQDWVVEEVLPSIRKTGQYRASGGVAPPPQMLVLPEQKAEAALHSYMNVAALLAVPTHICQREAVKAVAKNYGVDFLPLLQHSAHQDHIQEKEMWLEVSDAAELLGVTSGSLGMRGRGAGNELNLALCYVGWIERARGNSVVRWVPTKEGEKHCYRHHWDRNGKDGYNLKWKLSSLRDMLQERFEWEDAA